MSLAVLIITVGPVVSFMLLVVLIHSGDVLLVCHYSDLLDCQICIPLKDCWLQRCNTCTVSFSWFGGWRDILKLDVLGIAHELFPVIIIFVRPSLLGTGGFASASPQIAFAICIR